MEAGWVAEVGELCERLVHLEVRLVVERGAVGLLGRPRVCELARTETYLDPAGYDGRRALPTRAPRDEDLVRLRVGLHGSETCLPRLAELRLVLGHVRGVSLELNLGQAVEVEEGFSQGDAERVCVFHHFLGDFEVGIDALHVRDLRLVGLPVDEDRLAHLGRDDRQLSLDRVVELADFGRVGGLQEGHR